MDVEYNLFRDYSQIINVGREENDFGFCVGQIWVLPIWHLAKSVVKILRKVAKYRGVGHLDLAKTQ